MFIYLEFMNIKGNKIYLWYFKSNSRYYYANFCGFLCMKLSKQTSN